MDTDFQSFQQAVSCLSPPLQALLLPHSETLARKIREIRLRLNRPISLICSDTVYYIHSDSLIQSCGNQLFIASKQDIDAVFQNICRHSVYSRQNEIINGFVTLQGGHRAGISGTAVVQDGSITNVRDISSINIRIARQRIGCAERLYRSLGNISSGVLICGEPCSGKTTIIRDLARLISTVGKRTVSLIDERGELAASSFGIIQNDVGLCDVYDGYPKHEAMLQSIRSMSPEVIICDEIGSDEDVAAIEKCVNSGAAIIATVHASNPEELIHKKNMTPILKTNAFSDIVFLSGRRSAGEMKEIIKAGDLPAA